MRVSFNAYALASCGALLALFFYTVYAHESLYHALYFLSTARVSVALFANALLMLLIAASRLFVVVFLGRLRDLEVEQAFDAGRGFLLDTVMFLVLSSPTIENQEVPTVGILQFVGFIVALKVFHLISQTRVAHFFETGAISVTNVFRRLLGLIVVLACVDALSVYYFYTHAGRKSSLYLWLLFECLGMSVSALSNLAKFTVHYIDSQLEGGWPGTSASIFFLEVISDILSLLVFLVFMIVFVINYPSRLPIHMTSDIILVARTLFVKLRSFQRYQKLIKEMTSRFPEASAEDIRAADTCIICRDVLYEGARRLPCGHVFHMECLKAWFVQQQSCPTCRADVLQQSSEVGATTVGDERGTPAPDTGAQPSPEAVEPPASVFQGVNPEGAASPEASRSPLLRPQYSRVAAAGPTRGRRFGSRTPFRRQRSLSKVSGTSAPPAWGWPQSFSCTQAPNAGFVSQGYQCVLPGERQPSVTFAKMRLTRQQRPGRAHRNSELQVARRELVVSVNRALELSEVFRKQALYWAHLAQGKTRLYGASDNAVRGARHEEPAPRTGVTGDTEAFPAFSPLESAFSSSVEPSAVLSPEQFVSMMSRKTAPVEIPRLPKRSYRRSQKRSTGQSNVDKMR